MRVLAKPSQSINNAYIDQLYNGLTELGVNVSELSFRNLFSKSDLLHIHWPESVLTKRSLVASASSFLRFYLTILWIKIFFGTKIIWTVHNLQPHERHLPEWWKNFFYNRFLKLLDGCIFLSASSKQLFEKKYNLAVVSSIIPHGHYCDVFNDVDLDEEFRKSLGIKETDKVLGHYGRIRRYKNIPFLISEFMKIDDQNMKLIIAGKCPRSESSILKEIKTLVEKDDRVFFIHGFVSNYKLAQLFNITNLAVFPYEDILNSGSAILSLSLKCPILVPNNRHMLELKDQLDKDLVKLISNNGLDNDIIESIKLDYDIGNANDYLEGFGWDKVLSKTLKFYETVNCHRDC